MVPAITRRERELNQTRRRLFSFISIRSFPETVSFFEYSKEGRQEARGSGTICKKIQRICQIFRADCEIGGSPFTNVEKPCKIDNL